jgi:hypothetical protein
MAHQKTHSRQRGQGHDEKIAIARTSDSNKFAIAAIPSIAVLGENDPYWATALC